MKYLFLVLVFCACEADYRLEIIPVEDPLNAEASLGIDYGTNTIGVILQEAQTIESRWMGDRWLTNWPFGDECIEDYPILRCFSYYSTPLSEGIARCLYQSDGVWLDGMDRIYALAWVSCTCVPDCPTAGFWVAAPIFIEGERI